jgi:uncharacterized protein
MTRASSSEKKANRLIHAASPYLQQHAYNPVDWFEWGEEALAKAKQEGKPILVSIGYSSCHWCHVMERESFEDDTLAATMNELFVCIKVDREERPDIDQVYMEAVQTMGIHGGWPLNVFLTPDQKPFFGGTYFTPQAWASLLQNVSHAYKTRKKEVIESADELTRIISASSYDQFRSDAQLTTLTHLLTKTYTNLEGKFDTVWGGMNWAPKFITPSVWLWLLRYYHLSGNENALKHLNLTLAKILDGGIYDQVGGGFARYSVDAEWFAPHFEKMLYDNAQLLSLYSEAYSVTKNPDYRRAVYETCGWLLREMTSPQGGFYSALDADSEGVEGKFYSWKKHELTEVLGKDAELFCNYFGVTETGNWEHRSNILKRVAHDEAFLNRNHLTSETWSQILSRCKTRLLEIREGRIRPGLDDKILTGWNAMMVCGLIDAYHTFDDPEYLSAAKRNIAFLEANLVEGGKIYRSFKDKRSDTEGFLEDYAYLIKAYLKLYQAEFNEDCLDRAHKWMTYTLQHFSDPDSELFFYTSLTAEKLIARKKELFDNVIPASNSLMAMNLHHLGIFLDKPDWKANAEKMVNSFTGIMQSAPNDMSNWGIAYMEFHAPLAEVGIVGENLTETRNNLHQHYLPFALYAGTTTRSFAPLLAGKTALGGQTTLYVCRNYSCKQPVHEIEEAVKLILNKP